MKNFLEIVGLVTNILATLAILFFIGLILAGA